MVASFLPLDLPEARNPNPLPKPIGTRPCKSCRRTISADAPWGWCDDCLDSAEWWS